MLQKKKRRTKNYLMPLLMAMIVFYGCNTEDNNEETGMENVIEVVTTNMDFQVADEIPSGWNTFHYKNNSEFAHFILLDKYPEGKTIEDGKREVVPVFQKGMDLISAGKPDSAMAEFGKLPEWFSKIIFTGGSGFVSPGHSSITSLKLDPGYYVMECYVKMPDGMFHSSMGMLKAFTVTDTESGLEEPVPTVNVSISSAGGFLIADEILKGKNTFQIYIRDQKVYENFVGHDINLVKIGDNANMEDLEKWMNWADPKGLTTPAPQGFTFIGGVNDMPAESTGYFTADLEPGSYAFISEVPNASEKGLLKAFEVTD